MEEQKKKIVKEKSANQAILKLNKELRRIKNESIKRGSLTRMNEHTKRELDSMITTLDNVYKKNVLSWAPATEKFFTTIGIEYTFLKRPNDKRIESAIIKKMTAMSDKRQSWNKKIHVDGLEIIEFASPAHKNWDEMLSTYKKTVSTAKKCGLIFKRHDKGGGAGHIHMGIPRHWKMSFRLKFLKMLFLDISSRPYLNWIFNEPSDDKNANSMLMTFNCIKFLRESNNNTYIDFGKLLENNDKSHAIRYDEEYDTIEMRFFNMMENEKILEECVEFANAYFIYIYNITRNNFYIYDYGVEYYNLNKTSLDKYRSKKATIEEFNKLLILIGLNPNRYKKYIAKNYDARIALNKTGVLKMDYDIISNFNFAAIDDLSNDSYSPEITAERNNLIDRLRGIASGITTQVDDSYSPEITAEVFDVEYENEEVDGGAIGESICGDFEVSESISSLRDVNFLETSSNGDISRLTDLIGDSEVTISENSI